MKWIKISDRLPEIGEPVLTCNMNGISSDQREPIILFIEESDNKWYRPWDINEEEQPAPTHWMPLPKLPEEIELRNVEDVRSLQYIDRYAEWLTLANFLQFLESEEMITQKTWQNMFNKLMTLKP